MDVDDTLSERVADSIRARLAYRRRRGTTPSSGKELAAMVGISQSGMSARLTGATPIDLNDLERIAEALEVEIGDLLPKPAYRDERRNTASKPVRAERTMRSAHIATEGCTHSGDQHRVSDISANQVRRPVIKSWRDGEVTRR